MKPLTAYAWRNEIDWPEITKVFNLAIQKKDKWAYKCMKQFLDTIFKAGDINENNVKALYNSLQCTSWSDMQF